MGKKRFLILVLSALVVTLLPLTAQANLVKEGDFQATSSFTNLPFTFNPTANAGIWLAVPPNPVPPTTPTTTPGWFLNTTNPANKFAEKFGTGATTLLVQGFLLPDICSCDMTKWIVKYSFAYKSPGGAGEFKIYGFNDTVVSGNVALDGTTSGVSNTYPVPLIETDAWDTVKGEVILAGNHAALAVSFDLDSDAENAGVDDVSVDLVAPIAVKFTPTTFNVKSKGVVTVTLSKAPDCLGGLDKINEDSIRLVFGDSTGISPIPGGVHRAAKKLILKFSRQDLADMLGDVPRDSRMKLLVTGIFEAACAPGGEIGFEGTIPSLRVIDPGKPKPPKGPKS